MVNAGAAFVFPVLALALAFAALHLSTVLNSQRRAGATTCGEAETPLLDGGAAEVVLLPLATLLVLFFAVALIYHHRISRRIAAAAGNARRSVSALVMFLLCVSAGTLESIVIGQAAGGGGAGHGAQARRAQGQAALRALPGAATVTFFCGMMLIVVGVAHVPAGGEAAGDAAVAGDGPIQGVQRLLTKVAAGAAVALVCLMAMALTC